MSTGVPIAACWFALGVLVLTVSSGCSVLTGLSNQFAYNEGFDEMALGWRNRVWANEAWNEHESQFAGHPHIRDIERGFKDGYIEAASGGTGCLPITPPRRYWSWRYNSRNGQGAMNAWFEGFPYGVNAAEEAGVVFYGQIPVSDAVSRQIQQHHPHAQFQNSRHWTAPEAPANRPWPPREIILPGEPALADPHGADDSPSVERLPMPGRERPSLDDIRLDPSTMRGPTMFRRPNEVTIPLPGMRYAASNTYK